MKNIILLLILSIFVFASCEKQVEIDIPDPESEYVVEAWIENDKNPIVIVSRNSSYFSSVDSASLMNLFVTDAEVVVSDGIISDTLSLTIDYENYEHNTWPIIYYTGNKIIGRENHSYSLKIKTADAEISGSTYIPTAYFFDTLWWKPDNNTGDSLGYVWATFSDNPNEKNYYRIFTQRLGKDYAEIPVYGSIYDDTYFSGENISFSMYRGVQSISDDSSYTEEFGYFKPGDTVVVRLSAIDYSHYNFWMSVEQSQMTSTNPFTNPVNIKHNVVGAAGVFGGYGSRRDTLIIQ